MSATDRWRPFRTWLPLILVAAGSAALGIAGLILLDESRQPIPAPGSSQTAVTAATLQPDVEALKERLELYDRRARDLQTIMAGLLAIGAIFALLQGVFAFFSVQNFNTQAEAAVKKAAEAGDKIGETRKALVRDFRRKMGRQFPIAARMEQAVNDAVHLLDEHFQDADWYEEIYTALTPAQRQQIYFYERVVSGFTSLNVPRLKEPIGRAFRGLGSFYTSKYLAGRARPGVPSPLESPLSSPLDVLQAAVQTSSEDDLDRARFYLQMALERKPDDFAAMNMLGYIALVCETPSNPPEARRHFEMSRSIHAAQQRAPYNLADIAFLYDKNLTDAIGLYREALTHRRWEFRPNNKNTHLTRFNLACVLAQRWWANGAAQDAEESLTLLEQVMRSGRDYVAEYLERERHGSGNLTVFNSDPGYAQRLEEIRAL